MTRPGVESRPDAADVLPPNAAVVGDDGAPRLTALAAPHDGVALLISRSGVVLDADGDVASLGLPSDLAGQSFVALCHVRDREAVASALLEVGEARRELHTFRVLLDGVDGRSRALDGVVTCVSGTNEGDVVLWVRSAPRPALSALLQRVTEICNEALTGDDAMEPSLGEICRTMGWPVGRRYTVASDGALRPDATWYPPGNEDVAVLASLGAEPEVASDASLAARASRTGRATWVADMSAAAEYARPELARYLGITGALAFPIIAGDTTVAVMQFLSREGTEPDDDLLDVLAGIGRQLGTVVERENATRDLARSNASRTALDALGAHASRGGALDDLLEDAAGRVAGVLGADFVAMFTLDEGQIHLRASSGWQPRVRAYPAGGDSFVSTVVRSDGPVALRDVGGRRLAVDFGGADVPAAAIGVPVLRGQTTVGAIVAYAREARTFDDDDAGFLCAVANLLAGAAARVEAEAALGERTKELGGLFAIGRAITGDLTRSALLEEVASQLRATLQVPEGSCAEVELDGESARSGDVAGESHDLSTTVVVGGRTRGTVRVRTRRDIPFLLPQERDVLLAVADSLARWLASNDARSALLESEERLSKIMGTAPVGILFIDASGAITFANPTAETILGVEASDLEGRVYNDASFHISGPDGGDMDSDELPFARVIRTGAPVYGAEFAIEQPEGTRVVLSVNAAPLRDVDGRITGMAASVIDVTERRRAQYELRQSRQRLQALFDNALEAIFLSDDDGRIIDLNPAAVRLLGREREALVGVKLASFVAGDATHLATQGRDLMVREGGLIGEAVIRRPGGGHVDVEFRAVANIMEGLHLAVARDVTHRRETERALEHSESRFRGLAENSDDLVYLMRTVPEPSFEYLNPATEQVTGYPPEAFYENPKLSLERVVPEDRHILERGRSTPDALPEKESFRWRRPDGDVVWLEESLTALRDETGAVIGVQGVIRDVTAHKRAEEVMRDALSSERDAVERLEHLNEMKNTFLQAVSHELRTPLTSVLGYAVTLEKRAADLTPDQIADFMGRISRSARRLEQLLGDLLDIDRMTRGIIEADRRRTDLAALVHKIVAEVDTAGHDVLLDIAPVVAEVDGPKVERIVSNLVGNAAKHTPEGTTIWIKVGPVEDGVILVVEDDGPGLPDEGRAALFEPFGQGPSAKDAASPGTGLGLSLVLRLTQLHEGDVTAEDRPGGGARFRVFLPGAAYLVEHEGAGGTTANTRESRAVEGDEPRRHEPLPAAATAVTEASRQLLHVETAEEATGVLVSLVHDLGGWTVPLRMARATSLALDLALGRGDPILPAAEISSRTRKTLEDILPGLVEQARRTLHLGRTVERPAETGFARTLAPGGLTRLAQRARRGDAVIVLAFDAPEDIPRSNATTAVERAADALEPILEEELDSAARVLRSTHDAYIVVVEEATAEAASGIVARIHEHWGESGHADVVLSAGIAAVGDGGGTDALARADEALEHARAVRGEADEVTSRRWPFRRRAEAST